MKPKITNASVDAALDYAKTETFPENYDDLPQAERREIDRRMMRGLLLAATTAHAA